MTTLESTTVDALLRVAWRHNGTDLLLTVGYPPMVRVDGQLHPVEGEPVLDDTRIRELLAEITDPSQVQRLEEERELDFAFGWADRARVRGNAFHQRGAPAIALRVIPEAIPDFDQIGLPASVANLAKIHQGLVLFTGPTGSGKSTSLASLVEWININRALHVITIEDPIEYIHESKRAVVSQREVGLDTHSFERALRSALREDPDVVLVGEMRDTESIAITLTLAETGHLVFSTLHTNDAAQALDRIVDVFPAERQPQIRMQLASVLRAVVAQRLVVKQGGGMTAAYEVLLANDAVRNLVREGRTRQLRNVIATSRSEGMQTLEKGLSDLVLAGVVSYHEAVAHALVPQEIERPAGI